MNDYRLKVMLFFLFCFVFLILNGKYNFKRYC